MNAISKLELELMLKLKALMPNVRIDTYTEKKETFYQLVCGKLVSDLLTLRQFQFFLWNITPITVAELFTDKVLWHDMLGIKRQFYHAGLKIKWITAQDEYFVLHYTNGAYGTVNGSEELTYTEGN